MLSSDSSFVPPTRDVGQCHHDGNVMTAIATQHNVVRPGSDIDRGVGTRVVRPVTPFLGIDALVCFDALFRSPLHSSAYGVKMNGIIMSSINQCKIQTPVC